MNRDSRIMISGSTVIMVLVMASGVLCGCSLSMANTLVQTGAGMGIAGIVVALGYEHALETDTA